VNIPEGEGHFLRRSLQYYRDSDTENADWIARALRDIEALHPNFLGPTSNGDREPQDRHFEFSLYARKEPFVRFGYVESRKTDAAHCETALKLLGFVVEKQLVDEANVAGNVKGKLFYHRPGDKAVADSIPKCMTDSEGELKATLRKVSAGPNPPDFQFVLTTKINSTNAFSYTSGDTPGGSADLTEVQERIEGVKRQVLPGLAPGTGVAYYVLRNARNEWWKLVSRYEIRDAAGTVIRPTTAHWEWFVLPAGSYSITPTLWSERPHPPVSFRIVSGGMTEITLGGSSRLGRVTYESRSVTGEKTAVHIKVWTQEKKGGFGWWNGWIDAGDGTGEVSFDLPPGVYRIGVGPQKAMNLFTDYFTVEAGKTITIRPINRGRIAVTNGKTPAGANAGVSTLAKEFVGWLDFRNNDYVEVPAGEYSVANSNFNRRVVVTSGQTVFVDR
jgi:hypothetical protein